MSQTSPENQLKEALAALSELKTLAESFKTNNEAVASAEERISKVESAVEEIKNLATAMGYTAEAVAGKGKGPYGPMKKDEDKELEPEAAESNTIEGVNKTIVKDKKKDALALDKEDVEELKEKPLKKSKKAAEEEEGEDEEEEAPKSKKAKKAAEEMEEDEEEEEAPKSKKAKKAADEEEEDEEEEKAKKAALPPQFLKNIKKKKEEMEDEETAKKTKAAEEAEEDEDEDEEEEVKSKKSKKADDTVAPEVVAQESTTSVSDELEALKAKHAEEVKAREDAMASVSKMKTDFESLLERIAKVEAAEIAAEAKVAKAVADMGAEPVADSPVAEDDKPKSAEEILKEWQSIKDARESRAFYLKNEEVIRSATFGKIRKNA
jgi:hypothetical protein